GKPPRQSHSHDRSGEDRRFVEILFFLPIEADARLLGAERRQPPQFEAHRYGIEPPLFDGWLGRLQTAEKRHRCEAFQRPCLRAIESEMLDRSDDGLGLRDGIYREYASQPCQEKSVGLPMESNHCDYLPEQRWSVLFATVAL